MTGPDIDTALDWRGRTVRDPDGEKIGSLGDVYLDEETDRPAWGGVRTGLFGRGESLIPLERVTTSDDGDLHVPFPRDVVKDAPRVDPDVSLDRSEEDRLYAYYDGGGQDGRSDVGDGGSHAADAGGRDGTRFETDAHHADDRPTRSGDAAPTDDDARAAEDHRGRTDADVRTADETRVGDARTDDARTDEHPDAMIRSEEEVTVKDGPMRPAERVRLKKVLVTDHVEKTVPVRREVVQLEHEPPPAGTVESVEDVDERGPERR